MCLASQHTRSIHKSDTYRFVSFCAANKLSTKTMAFSGVRQSNLTKWNEWRRRKKTHYIHPARHGWRTRIIWFFSFCSGCRYTHIEMYIISGARNALYNKRTKRTKYTSQWIELNRANEKKFAFFTFNEITYSQRFLFRRSTHSNRNKRLILIHPSSHARNNTRRWDIEIRCERSWKTIIKMVN